jgi:hypothetical protein
MPRGNDEMKEAARLIFELSKELDCTPYAIVDSLVGMEISDEDAHDIKEIISARGW